MEANISRFFCRLPTLISYVSNFVWFFRGVVLVFWAFSFEKTPKRSGCHTVSREPRCVYILSVRGSVLLMKCSGGQVHDSSVSAWTQSLFELGKRLLVRSNATKVSAQVVFTPMQSAQPYNLTNSYAQFFQMKTPKPPTQLHKKNSPDCKGTKFWMV